MHDPDDDPYSEGVNRKRLDELIAYGDRGDLLDSWYDDARLMLSQMNAAHRVVIRLSDGYLSPIVDATNKAVLKHWKGADRAYKKYQMTRSMVVHMPTREEQLDKIEEWEAVASDFALRMYKLTNAWNAYRKACLIETEQQ